MTAVWYVGSSDKRIITAAQWAQAGVSGVSTAEWSSANGWSLPASSLNAQQLAVLQGTGEFNVNGNDGPRPGSTVANNKDHIQATQLYVDTAVAAAAVASRKSMLNQSEHFWPRLHSTNVNPDVTEFLGGSAPLAGATVTLACAAGGVLNAANFARFDMGQASGTPQVYSGNWVWQPYPGPYGHRSIRFYTDSQYVSIALYYGQFSGAKVWVDGQPAAANNQLLMTVANVYANLTFSSRKTRFIEVKTDCMFAGVNIAPNCDVWPAAPMKGPRVLVVGDSLVQGYYATGGFGMFQLLDDMLDLEWLGIDGMGGSGYVVGGSFNLNYQQRVPAWVASGPDVVIVEGGGTNDLYQGTTVEQVQDGIEATFTALRSALPDAKLAYMEGWLTPLFANAGQGAQYDELNPTIPGLLADLDVHAITGMRSWISGTGYQGAANGSGNSDFYVYTDGTHPNDDGSQYLAKRMVAPLMSILEAAS